MEQHTVYGRGLTGKAVYGRNGTGSGWWWGCWSCPKSGSGSKTACRTAAKAHANTC